MTLAAIAEDSGSRLITAAELLAGVTDVDGPALAPSNLAIAHRQRLAGRQSQRHLDLHAGAQRRQLGDVQLHGVGRHAEPVATTATLDITPVNDAPVATPVRLGAIAEDSGSRLITAAELLAGVTDVDGPRYRRSRAGDRVRQRRAGRQSQRDLELHAGAQRRQLGDVHVHGVVTGR